MRDWRKAKGYALTIAEREFLFKSATAYKEGYIVNIGIAFGGSLYCLRAGAPGAKLTGVDIEKPKASLDKDLRCKVVIADSRTCHVGFVNPIDLLFIDGDHHYAGVRADITNWLPKVSIGGIVIFHDYAPLPRDLKKNPWIMGVRKAVTEWNKRGWERIPAPDSLAAFRRVDARS